MRFQEALQLRHPGQASSSDAPSVTPSCETRSAAGFATWCATVSNVFPPARMS
jgi:hypothetical protein